MEEIIQEIHEPIAMGSISKLINNGIDPHIGARLPSIFHK